MKIDIGQYRANKEWLKRIFDREMVKEGYDRSKQVSLLSSLTGIPVIALLHFYGEFYGYDEDLRFHIQRITDFYGYTEVIK